MGLRYTKVNIMSEYHPIDVIHCMLSKNKPKSNNIIIFATTGRCVQTTSK